MENESFIRHIGGNGEMTSSNNGNHSSTTKVSLPPPLSRRYQHRKKRRNRNGGGGGSSSKDFAGTSQKVGICCIIFIFMMFAFALIQTIRSIPETDTSNSNYSNNRSSSSWSSKSSLFRTKLGGEIIISRNGISPLEPKQTNKKKNNSQEVQDDESNNREKDDEYDYYYVNDAGGTDSNKGDNGSRLVAPVGLWPVSIQKEDEDRKETIAHPGNPQEIMVVPKFWSEPLHNKEFFSREQAMEVGTCITPDADTGSHQLGDACPVDDRTIFVAIASYRDYQCRITVESIFQRAKYPARIRVAVVDQIVPEEDDVKCNDPIESCHVNPQQALCQYIDQVDVYEMHARLAVGPVFARHIGHRLYRGEYYAMQSDAHVTFTQDWDVDIIQQQEATGDEMAVQSTYLTDITGSIDPATGKSLRRTRPIMCNTDYEGGVQGKHLRHLSQPEGMPTIARSPQLEPYWAAGFSFGRGHFVVNVPYDLYQPMIFQGEEMSIGIRGFTVGYDYFATQRSVCFHHYAIGPNAAERNKVKHFWDNSNLYKGTGIKAMKRLLGIVNMNPEVNRKAWNHDEEDRYGLGGVRTTKKFYETFGIDVVNKVTEHHLCQFVNGKMHNMFMQHLRDDGMGIDYSKIQFQFKDPEKK